MNDSAKDALAAIVEERWVNFQVALSDSKRKYPVQEFRMFAQAVRSYIEQSRNDPLIHRNVVQVVNGLTDSFEVGYDRIPNKVLEEAARLESLMFAGYDPHFEGDEPPGL
jgi:hypothetical protein